MASKRGPSSVVPASAQDRTLERPPSEPMADDRHQRPLLRLLDSTGMSLAGVLYVGATLFASYGFIGTARDFLTNDMFWPSFNATTGGVFVARAFNLVLSGATTADSVTLLDPRFAYVNSANNPISTVALAVSPHYARLLQFHRLTSVEHGIEGLRSISAVNALYVFGHYCWVDFDRRWSVAHTEKRAERCLETQQDNAAVYLESLLRNVIWADMAGKYPHFQAAYVNELQRTADGAAFWASVRLNQTTSVAEEAAYWRSKGLKRYTLQYNNAKQLGVKQSVSIVNAFGIPFSFTIKDVEFKDRWTMKTSNKLYWSLGNDLWSVVDNNTKISGMSLIRNSSMFYENRNHTMEHVMMDDGAIATPLTPQDELVRAALGPFGAIDGVWTAYPPELSELVVEVQNVVLKAAMASNEARNAYFDISLGIQLYVRPRKWVEASWAFAGGSVLCGSVVQLPYVVSQFGFDAVCGNTGPVSEKLIVNRFSYVFAALTAGIPLDGDLMSICVDGMSVVNSGKVCAAELDRALKFVATFLSVHERRRIAELAASTQSILRALNVSIVQFGVRGAGNATEYELLVEPLLSTNATSGWNVFGMLYFLDWATGAREVVKFHGDHGQLTLISTTTPTVSISPNRAEVLQSVCPYIRYALWYVTGMLFIVAIVVLLQALVARLHIAGFNLLEFNRVGAIVWVGRPLLALRGVMAIAIISTARPELITDGHYTTMFEPRENWFTSILTAGEATWFLCVVIDVLLVFSQGWTYAVAPATHAVVWSAIALMQLIKPLSHTVMVQEECKYVDFLQLVSCTAGSIKIGNSTRFASIMGICGVSLVVCYIVVRRFVPRRRTLQAGANLPFIAQEVFVSTGWSTDDEWVLDPASAALAGFVTFAVHPVMRIINVKTFSLMKYEQQEPKSPHGKDSGGPQHVRYRRAMSLRHLEPDALIRSDDNPSTTAF